MAKVKRFKLFLIAFILGNVGSVSVVSAKPSRDTDCHDRPDTNSFSALTEDTEFEEINLRDLEIKHGRNETMRTTN